MTWFFICIGVLFCAAAAYLATIVYLSWKNRERM